MPDQAIKHDSHSKSNVYQCVKVISEFKAGKFEQTLEAHCLCFLFRQAKTQQPLPAIPNGAQDGDQGRPVPSPRPNSGSSILVVLAMLPTTPLTELRP
jgi:hypothetical protein